MTQHPYERHPYERHPYERHPYERHPFERHPYDRDPPAIPGSAGSPDVGLGIEMFLVRPAVEADAGCIDEISDVVVSLGGVVLMATGGGGLVVGLPPGRKDGLAGAACTGFVGGVSFAEDAPGLAALKQKFALNAARQLAAQGRTRVGATPPHPGAAPTNSRWGDRLVDPRTVLATARTATTTRGPSR